MGRIKSSPNELIHEEQPMVIRKEEKEEGNGIIPVKYDDIEVFYDTNERTYFAKLKIGMKKIRLEMTK